MNNDNDEDILRPCSDANCILAETPRKGMCTHGGCQHLKKSGPELNKLLKTMGAEISRLKTVIESMLIAASEAVGDDRGMERSTPAESIEAVVKSLVAEKNEALQKFHEMARVAVEDALMEVTP